MIARLLLIPRSPRVSAHAAIYRYGRPKWRLNSWCSTLAKCQWRILSMAGRIRYAWVHFLVVPTLPVPSVVHSELESCATCNNTAAKKAGKRRELDLDIANL